MKPYNLKYIGGDRAMVTLNKYEPFDWSAWRRQKAANELGVGVEELPLEPDNGAEHSDEQELEERIYEED